MPKERKKPVYVVQMAKGGAWIDMKNVGSVQEGLREIKALMKPDEVMRVVRILTDDFTKIVETRERIVPAHTVDQNKENGPF